MRFYQKQRGDLLGRPQSQASALDGLVAGSDRFIGDDKIQRDCRLKLKFDDALLPVWAGGDTLELMLPLVLRRPLDGEPLAYFVDGTESWPAIVHCQGDVVTNFPLEETVRYLLSEAYMDPPPAMQKIIGRLPRHYQYIPPHWRMRILQELVQWRRRTDSPDSFPRWPGDDSVDLLRHVYRQCQELARGVLTESSPLWPHGKKYAVAFTHDVDTPWCLETQNQLAEIEERHGIRSAWYVVGEHLQRPEAAASVARLVEKGHEVGCHGWRHEPSLSSFPPAKLNATLQRCVQAMGKYGKVHGFRAPFLSRGLGLYSALETLFVYDASCPDSERYVTSARSGCCTAFPYFIGELLELPLTLPQDAVLMAMGYRGDEIHRIWRDKVDWIKARGGLALASTHPEPQFGASPPVLQAYDQLVSQLVSDGEAWLATPAQVAAWWLERGEVQQSIGSLPRSGLHPRSS